MILARIDPPIVLICRIGWNLPGKGSSRDAAPNRFKHLYIRNFLGANYLVIFEQQGVITSLLPALPHDYFLGSWTAAPERITVGHKTRFLCQTDRMEATVVALRPVTRGITVNERGGCPAK